MLNNIPFQVDLAGLMAELHMKQDGRRVEEVRRLAQEAQSIARPKAIFKVAFIDSKDTRTVVVEGVMFTSRVLRVNLESAQRVFPFVVTCGMELEAWSRSQGDVLHRFWAETINEMALRVATAAMREHLEQTLRPGPTSMMNPGSLEDWPLQEQRALFGLLGDPRESVGVYLTDSLLMVPVKTISGILFPTAESFASCQLCPREVCPSRRAPYDPSLKDKYGIAQPAAAP